MGSSDRGLTLKRLDLSLESLARDEDARASSYCFIVRNDRLDDVLADEFGRDGLCLKVFKRTVKPGEKVEDFKWGKVLLVEATKVQNLFAFAGLSPRVYGIVSVNGDRFAQVTDHLTGRVGEWHAHKIPELLERYSISTKKWQDFGVRNWVDGKFVDFSEFCFEDVGNYEQSLVERAYVRKRGSNPASTAYQSVPELGIKGTRDMEHRSTILQLDRADFTGKTVLDLGCNLGAFCRLACDRGAKRVVGVDRGVELTREISNWLGYWNVDYLDLSLPVEADQVAVLSNIGTFDIVFSLAVHNYMEGDVDWMADLCQHLLLFEGHGGDAVEVYDGYLHKNFDFVEHLGQTTDNYERQVFQARKFPV